MSFTYRLFAIILMVLANCSYATQSIKFDHLSLEQGLSQATVFCMLQDSKGFMWFGTEDGLNKYDGYKFTVYRNDPENRHSLSSNWINALYEDSQRILWIGTEGGGLNRFDPKTGKFTHYQNDPNNPHSISHNTVLSIYQDLAGIMWIGTDGGGVNKFDRQTDKFVRYLHEPNNSNSLSHNKVLKIIEDRFGKLWIGTYEGLDQFDRTDEKFTHYFHNPKDPHSLSRNTVLSLFEDKTGVLWVGTEEGGLNRFNREQNNFNRYQNDPSNPKSLSHNSVWSIYEDQGDTLWVATHGGLNKLDRKTDEFTYYLNDSQNIKSLSHNAVWSIYEDKSGIIWVSTLGGLNKFERRGEKFTHYLNDSHNLKESLSDNNVRAITEDRDDIIWIGTYGGGLNRFDRHMGKFKHYLNEPKNPNSLIHNNIRVILEDHTGLLWIGTYAGGLDKFDHNTNTFTHYLNDPDDPHSLSDNNVMALFEDKDNRLWVGTYASGLDILDPATGRFTHYTNDPNDSQSIIDNSVKIIFEDSTGTLWLGTHGGLSVLDRKTGKFTHYLNNEKNLSSLSNNGILSIHEDSTNTLWIGTLSGLNKFDRATKTFTQYKEKDGIANEVIYGILEDSNRHLWLSTNKGLSKFDLEQGTFRNYDISDGLQSNEFNIGAYYKTHSGELLFGGINGFNLFNPEHIKDNTHIPPVYISAFQKFNKDVKLDKDVSELRAIELSYRDYVFSFEFAALDYTAPLKNLYAYMLEGFDKDWVYITAKRRFATYTNLNSGNYTFKVKASNNDNVWNEHGASVKITVYPPPWKTWWAYTLYSLTMMAILFSIFKRQKEKLQEKQRELEREKDSAEKMRQLAEKLKQMDKLKDEFLANTSHELRTPLNGIIGIAESLIDGATGVLTEATSFNLKMIVSSGRRLANLVNDILDFSQLQHKKITLQLKSVSIYNVVEVVVLLSRPLIGDKKLELINKVPQDLPIAYADENRLQQILHNLIGNAIKFTEKGIVNVSAKISQQYSFVNPFHSEQFSSKSGDNWFVISVSDTGIGIPENKYERIFESFEQAEGSTARKYGGTGLGLAVSKRLIELHGGHIWVESIEGVGTVFSFTLPVSKIQVSAQEEKDLEAEFINGIQTLDYEEKNNIIPLETNIKQSTTITDKPISSDSSMVKVLIVDDEPVNLQVLVNHLSLHRYFIERANSGMEALKKLEEGFKPDLILLDVMMPQMTGYEVTQKIRTKWKADELPILLLTAKNQVTDLVLGLDAGANDYLTKPVNKDELLARIKTHLNIRSLKADNIRMSTELNLVRRLQQMVLPREKELKDIKGLEVAGFMEPAEEVGGDYYDVLQHQGRILFGIGDVTGHGLESGVLMLMVQMAVRTLLIHQVPELKTFLTVINRAVYENANRMNSKKNLTLSLLEYQDNKLSISGQHEDVIVVREGHLECIDTVDLGFMIGMKKDISRLVDQLQIELAPNDIVILYTDGITEAKNLDNKEYGRERLCHAIRSCWQSPAEQIRQIVIDDVRQFIGSQKVFDDITLLVIKQL